LSNLDTPTTVCAVLHAATTANSALKRLHLQNIPVSVNDHLLQLISAARRSAMDVCLDFSHSNRYQEPQFQPFVQLEDTLWQNSALTSLELTFPDDPFHFFKFDFLLEPLTSLQTLKLAQTGNSSSRLPSTVNLPPMKHFINMPFLTHVCLGHGFHLEELSEMIPHMTRLQALSLRGSC
jgi:hypothetical protein